MTEQRLFHDSSDTSCVVHSSKRFGIATEKGSAEENLHLQMLIETRAKSAAVFTKYLKKCLGIKPGSGTDIRMLSRLLTGKRLHTWHGMCGYITKDDGLPHYELVSEGITDGVRLVSCVTSHLS